MRLRGMSTNPGSTALAAGTLFVFHAALFCWWGFGQVYWRVLSRFIRLDPTFLFRVIDLCFITTSLIVTVGFARTLRGTAAESAARAAIVFAIIDLVCETLQ